VAVCTMNPVAPLCENNESMNARKFDGSTAVGGTFGLRVSNGCGTSAAFAYSLSPLLQVGGAEGAPLTNPSRQTGSRRSEPTRPW
jgi:hypothetical protein